MSIVLKSILWSGHQALTLRGFQFEVQRHGEAKLGLWRKKLRGKGGRKKVPSRLVFIPGFGDTPLSWLGVMTLMEPVLRNRFDEIVLVDLPGHNGRLVSDGLFPSVDALMDSLFDALDSLKPVAVMGHSLGGFLSAHYAAACSTGTRVTGKTQGYSGLDTAIVIDPSGYFASDDERREWVEKMEKLIHDGGDFWRPFVFAEEPTWFRFVGAPFFKFLAREEVAPFLRSGRAEHEVGPILPLIRSKMAVVWGEEDALFPSAYAPSWLKGLTHTKEPPVGVLIKGAGHSPQLEATATTAAVLAQLLTGRKPHALGSRWYKVL